MKAFSFLSLILLVSCQSETSFPNHKLVGDWVRIEVPENEKTIEHWEQQGDSIIGFGRTFINDSLYFQELLSIVLLNDKYFYVVRGVNESATFFEIRAWDKKGFTAFNETNDFPKYISYSFRQDAMFVEIGDSTHSIDFNFIRID